MQTSELSIFRDMSAETIGFSCGDRLELDAAIQPDGTLQCRIGGDYCSVARRSSEVMIGWLAGKSVEEIVTALGERCPPASATTSCAGLTAAATRDRRTACVEAPWHALQGALSRWQEGRPDAKCFAALACDACVYARAITWGAAQGEVDATRVETEPTNRSTIASDVRNIVTKLATDSLSSGDRQAAHNQRFAKLDLTPDDVVEMERFLRHMNTEDGLREAQRAGIPNCFDNVKKHRPASIPRGFRRHFRQRQLALTLIVREAEAIRRSLLDAGIAFAFVKGVATRRFYGETAVRPFADIDILTPDAEAALAVVRTLLTAHGYRLTGEGSIPFSLKIIANADGEHILSGHMHVSRMIGRDTLVADIGFPSLPLGLLEVLDFPATSAAGDATAEELIIVSLAHMLKHEIAYAKDLNDIRLLLASSEYTLERLWNLIGRYKLDFAVSLACAVVLRDYQLSAEERVKVVALTERVRPVYRAASAVLVRKGWPFRSVAHRWAQAFDLFQRRTARVGARMALRQLRCTLSDEAIPVTGRPSSEGIGEVLGLSAFERLYLTPLVLNLGGRSNGGTLYGRSITTPNLRVIDDAPTRLVVTPFGIFLPTTSWHSAESRAAVESATRTAIAKIGWDRRNLAVVRNGFD